MKICQIMLARGFGGAEKYFVDLCHALAAAGHEVLALCHRGGEAESRLQAGHGLSLAPVQVMGWWDPLAVWRCRRYLREFGPVLVHAHLARAARIGGHALAGTAIPLLAKTHNYVDLKYYRRVDVFLPTTADQRRYLLEAGIEDRRITVIPNFSAMQAVTGIAQKDKPVHLLACGRFVRKKGFAQLLEAFARARTDHPDLELTLVGAGAEAGRLRRIIDRHGLAGHVHMPGWQRDIGSFLDRADVFVLPSLDEPFGIVLLEAMARGVPIIATRTRGPAEVLDENSALLVEPGDVDQLHHAIACAASDPAGNTMRAETALHVFSNHYSSAAVVPRLVRVYESLLP